VERPVDEGDLPATGAGSPDHDPASSTHHPGSGSAGAGLALSLGSFKRHGPDPFV
jgi:hypothetical protein